MQKLIIPLCAIFVASCAKNTQSVNSDICTTAICSCNIIYGLASDWDVISDELARNIYRHNKMCESMR